MFDSQYCSVLLCTYLQVFCYAGSIGVHTDVYSQCAIAKKTRGAYVCMYVLLYYCI